MENMDDVLCILVSLDTDRILPCPVRYSKRFSMSDKPVSITPSGYRSSAIYPPHLFTSQQRFPSSDHPSLFDAFQYGTGLMSRQKQRLFLLTRNLTSIFKGD